MLFNIGKCLYTNANSNFFTIFSLLSTNCAYNIVFLYYGNSSAFLLILTYNIAPDASCRKEVFVSLESKEHCQELLKKEAIQIGSSTYMLDESWANYPGR